MWHTEFNEPVVDIWNKIKIYIYKFLDSTFHTKYYKWIYWNVYFTILQKNRYCIKRHFSVELWIQVRILNTVHFFADANVCWSAQHVFINLLITMLTAVSNASNASHISLCEHIEYLWTHRNTSYRNG